VCQHNIHGYIHGFIHGYPYPRQAWWSCTGVFRLTIKILFHSGDMRHPSREIAYKCWHTFLEALNFWPICRHRTCDRVWWRLTERPRRLEKQNLLDGQGKVRHEAARRRNSECNLNSRNSSRSNASRPTAVQRAVMAGGAAHWSLRRAAGQSHSPL